MSATLELTTESLEQWTMPKPHLGQQILWFQHANPDEEPQIAFVREVGKRGLTVQVGSVPIDQVRHISDPKLKINEFQKLNGAWDFPDSQREMEELRQRVATLEKLVATLHTDRNSKGKHKDECPL